MMTAEEKWKREQLLVPEKIREDPAAGRENQNAKSKSTSRHTKARIGLYTEHCPAKAHTSYWIQWQQKRRSNRHRPGNHEAGTPDAETERSLAAVLPEGRDQDRLVVAPIEQKDERWRENQNRNDVLAGRTGRASSMVGAGSDRATAQGIQL
jgi:hypothetical protein